MLARNVRSVLGPLKNQNAATLCDMSRWISIAQLGKYQFDDGNQIANQPARSDRPIGWQLARVGSKVHPMPSIDPSLVVITLERS